MQASLGGDPYEGEGEHTRFDDANLLCPGRLPDAPYALATDDFVVINSRYSKLILSS
jgi:hypothetical protein